MMVDADLELAQRDWNLKSICLTGQHKFLFKKG